MLRLFALFIFLLFNSCCLHPLVPNQNPPSLQPFNIPEQIRVALVLGSGGVRGMAHIGALEELEAAGVPIDLIVGCSAGSIVGALYAEKCCVEAIKPAIWEVKTESFMDINLWNCRYGVSQSKSLNRVLDKYLGSETFEQLAIPLIVVASDLCTGELIPMGSGDLVSAVQASCSIPFVFVPCEYQGRILVDGGVVNPVPAKIARDLGADIIIAIDLCELLPKTFPKNLFQIATRSAEIAFMWQNESCCSYADIVIRPKTCGIGAFQDSMKWDIYVAGKQATRQMLPEILSLISMKSNNWTHSTKQKEVHFEPYTPAIYMQD